MSMGWDESLSVGDSQVDEQHREIARLVKEIEDSIRAGRGELAGPQLESLRAIVQTHFEAEEAWMKSIGYPHVAEHRCAHLRGLQILQQATDAFARGEAADRFVDLAGRAASWLAIHLRAEDLRTGIFQHTRARALRSGVPS